MHSQIQKYTVSVDWPAPASCTQAPAIVGISENASSSEASSDMLSGSSRGFSDIAMHDAHRRCRNRDPGRTECGWQVADDFCEIDRSK